MDKYTIIAVVSPIITPAAPATILVNTLYSGMIKMGVEHNAALVASIASGIGAELGGMIASYAAIQAYRKGKRGHFITALVAFALYIAFMAAGIAAGGSPVPLILTVALSIIIYLGTAVLEDLMRGTTETLQTVTAQVSLVDAKTRLQNSANRAAKLAGSAPLVDAHASAHVSTQGRFEMAPGQIERIRAYWHDNPGASDREAARACECSPSSAKKYKGA